MTYIVWEICIKSTTDFNNLIRLVCANKHIESNLRTNMRLWKRLEIQNGTALGNHECHQLKEYNKKKRMVRKKVNDLKILDLMKKREHIMPINGEEYMKFKKNLWNKYKNQKRNGLIENMQRMKSLKRQIYQINRSNKNQNRKPVLRSDEQNTKYEQL